MAGNDGRAGRKKTGGRRAKKRAAAKGKAGTGTARSRGRPARISREAIIATSLQVLEEEPVEKFTLARVASRLDTVSMALYNYFDNREALLCAVADHICMGFRLPPAGAGQTWQGKLRAWLDAVRSLAEQYPVILKIAGIDGQTTAGWLRVTLTVSRTLHEQGMRGRELAVNSYLFCSQAIALIMFETTAPEFHSTMSLGHLDELEPDEQDFLLALRPYHISLTTDDILETGFQQMIEELALKLQT